MHDRRGGELNDVGFVSCHRLVNGALTQRIRMFPTQRLLSKSILCPEHETCQLSPCLFSHDDVVAAQSRSTNTGTTSTLKRPLTPTETTQQPKKHVRTTTNAYNPQARAARQAAASTSSLNPIASTSKSTTATVTTATDGPPRIKTAVGPAHTPTATRQKMLTALFKLLYSNVSTRQAQEWASLHAQQQEQSLYDKSTKLTYRNSVISSLARLKKRLKVPTEATEHHDWVGTLEQVDQKLKLKQEIEFKKLTRDKVEKFVSSKQVLETFDYVVEVPDGIGGDKPTEEGNMRKCDRCGAEFIVKAQLSEKLLLTQKVEKTACSYHWGRQITEKINGTKQRVWSCCPSSDLPPPCQIGPHVFRDSDVNVLHSRLGFLPTSIFESSTSDQIQDIVALDCELVYTTSGMSLARLTVIDIDFKTILDVHVKPLGTVLDTNERFSGVTEENLKQANVDGQEVRRMLTKFVNKDTIIVGHGLENDLKALRIIHLNVIDTAIIYPHPNGGSWRFALRNLTKEHLGKFIQGKLLKHVCFVEMNQGTSGHSAAEDSIAALELLQHKMLKTI
ncbi:RNA exonuclease 3 [Microbotryomycetes sp. JL221]|nr:RNA exonuclease 3 [Microbotryomycetes sp. JL221]